jgi:hypothetical protein
MTPPGVDQRGRSAGSLRLGSTWRVLAPPPAWQSGRGWRRATTPVRASNGRAGPGRGTSPSGRFSPNWPTLGRLWTVCGQALRARTASALRRRERRLGQHPSTWASAASSWGSQRVICMTR